jgi:dolichol kinase
MAKNEIVSKFEELREKLGERNFYLAIGGGLIIVALFSKVLLFAGFVLVAFVGFKWYWDNRKKKAKN